MHKHTARAPRHVNHVHGESRGAPTHTRHESVKNKLSWPARVDHIKDREEERERRQTERTQKKETAQGGCGLNEHVVGLNGHAYGGPIDSDNVRTETCAMLAKSRNRLWYCS